MTANAVAAAPAILPMASLKKEADVACVYHCDFNDSSRFQQMLVNIGNHYSVYGNPLELQIAIVAHGGGVKFFLETQQSAIWGTETSSPQIIQRISDLAKNGLMVYLCDITFERQKIDRETAYKRDFIKFVPSGVASVAALQSKGFAYIKVG